MYKQCIIRLLQQSASNYSIAFLFANLFQYNVTIFNILSCKNPKKVIRGFLIILNRVK